VYDRLIDSHPDDFRPYLAKGILLKQQKQEGEADRNFIKVSHVSSCHSPKTGVSPEQLKQAAWHLFPLACIQGWLANTHFSRDSDICVDLCTMKLSWCTRIMSGKDMVDIRSKPRAPPKAKAILERKRSIQRTRLQTSEMAVCTAHKLCLMRACETFYRCP
jgi:hypothetical protein